MLLRLVTVQTMMIVMCLPIFRGVTSVDGELRSAAMSKCLAADWSLALLWAWFSAQLQHQPLTVAVLSCASDRQTDR